MHMHLILIEVGRSFVLLLYAVTRNLCVSLEGHCLLLNMQVRRRELVILLFNCLTVNLVKEMYVYTKMCLILLYNVCSERFFAPVCVCVCVCVCIANFVRHAQSGTCREVCIFFPRFERKVRLFHIL